MGFTFSQCCCCLCLFALTHLAKTFFGCHVSAPCISAVKVGVWKKGEMEENSGGGYQMVEEEESEA